MLQITSLQEVPMDASLGWCQSEYHTFLHIKLFLPIAIAKVVMSLVAKYTQFLHR
jgi:hypothetical protein